MWAMIDVTLETGQNRKKKGRSEHSEQSSLLLELEYKLNATISLPRSEEKLNPDF